MSGRFQSLWSRRAVVLATCLGAWSDAAVFPALAEETPVFRQFMDKQGRTLEARPVTVSTDRRQLTIAFRDGKEATLDPLLLSLDDQQFLAEWVKTQPAAGHRLQVTVEKISAAPADRVREDDYRMTTEHPAYRVTVTNLSRESLTGATIEYYALIDNQVRIFKDPDDGAWDYSLGTRSDDAPPHVTEVQELPELAFNRSHQITTRPLSVEQVAGVGNFIYGEDRLHGAIVQIRDRNGAVIGEWHHTEAGMQPLVWKTLVEENTASGGVSPVASRRTNHAIEQGQSLAAASVDLSLRNLSIRAEIEPDPSRPAGVIASQGDGDTGWILQVIGSRLSFTVRAARGRTRTVTATLPSGKTRLEIEAELSADQIELHIDDELGARETAAGLFEKSPAGDVCVGFAAERTLWTESSVPDPYPGKIEDFRLSLIAPIQISVP